METNAIEKNDIIDGKAIVNRNFEIVTANEEFYRFIGIAKYYSIINVIHQVDMDDFIDVVNSLRVGQDKNMVIRMKSIDNSYHWVLLNVRREENANKLTDEYIVMHVSDIISMKKQNDVFRNTIQNFRHIMAMENELFFTYDYKKDVFLINTFIDNEIFNRFSATLEEARKYFLDHDYIPRESYGEYEGFFDDIRTGVVSYTRVFTANNIAEETAGFTNIEIKGTTIYNEMIPSRAVGNLKNLDETDNIYSKSTYHFNNTIELISKNEMKHYTINNVNLNKNCELALIHLSIDGFDNIKENFGKATADIIYKTSIVTMKKILGYRGVICELEPNLFGIIVKDSNTELNLRSFIEHLRTRISWECHTIYPNINITLSIGVARYPENSRNWKILLRKLRFAYERSVSKGGDNFVIYREHLHGEITEDDIAREEKEKTK